MRCSSDITDEAVVYPSGLGTVSLGYGVSTAIGLSLDRTALLGPGLGIGSLLWPLRVARSGFAAWALGKYRLD